MQARVRLTGGERMRNVFVNRVVPVPHRLSVFPNGIILRRIRRTSDVDVALLRAINFRPYLSAIDALKVSLAPKKARYLPIFLFLFRRALSYFLHPCRTSASCSDFAKVLETRTSPPQAYFTSRIFLFSLFKNFSLGGNSIVFLSKIHTRVEILFQQILRINDIKITDDLQSKLLITNYQNFLIDETKRLR